MHNAGWPYPTKKSLPYNNFMHGIYHEAFSVTTSVIIKRELMIKFRDDSKIVRTPIDEGWDIRWWKYMKKNNLEIYATKKSYVRQIEGRSILEGRKWSKLTHPEKYSEEFEE